MKTFKLLSEEEQQQLTKNDKTIEIKTPGKYQITDPDELTLYEFYKKRLKPVRDANYNTSKLYDMLEEIKNTSGDEYYSDNVIIENGYKISVYPRGTKFYKSLVWFYETKPNMERMWVGSLKVAAYYVRKFNFVGISCYKAINEIRMFNLTTENLTKLYNEPDTPGDIKEILENMYGINISLAEKIKRRGTPLTRVFPEVNCIENSVYSLYGTYYSHESTFKSDQNKLFRYVEYKFNCNSTLLPTLHGPLTKCQFSEITIRPSDVLLDETDKYYWKTLGYDKTVDIARGFTINESINNMNFKYVEWLKDCGNIKYNHSDILSINVHLFKSVTGVNEWTMVSELATFVRKVNPGVVIIQELPTDYKRFMIKEYPYSKFVPNGSHKDDMWMEPKTKMINIRKRGFLVLTINNIKILCLHALVGHRYNKGAGMINRKLFHDRYQKNIKNKISYFEELISRSGVPDIIIGDFNITEADIKILNFFTEKGYKQRNPPGVPTSIHNTICDYVFAKNNIPGDAFVYNWHHSDHRPIGFNLPPGSFDIQITGNDEHTTHPGVYMCFVLLLLFILFYIFWLNKIQIRINNRKAETPIFIK